MHVGYLALGSTKRGQTKKYYLLPPRALKTKNHQNTAIFTL